jgi:hypothetical protein
MLALSSSSPALSVELGKAMASPMVSFINARTGHPVPCLERDGKKIPLHSTFDPVKEGIRFSGHQIANGFLLFLGFAGGYQIMPFLEQKDVSGILIIEESHEYLKAVISAIDLKDLILDSRVQWLIPSTMDDVKQLLLESYLPAVSGNLRLLPLKTRTNSSRAFFDSVASVVRKTIDNFSEDYSVQSYFGKRWFTNSIRNLKAAGESTTTIRPVRRACITGAGPGLEDSLDILRNNKGDFSIIATDTSLPFLLQHKLVPDIVVSIDCQHITYHHFLSGFPEEVPLVLDLASPVFLSRLSRYPIFFTSGHPFSQFINTHWRKFPSIDTSGGNVSHAAVSLACALGAEEIHVYGADFSYPQGKSYARGTYLYPYFHSNSNRFKPVEKQFIDFIFRNESLAREEINGAIRYTTRPMVSYRNRLSLLAEQVENRIIHHSGDGLQIDEKPFSGPENRHRIGTLLSSGRSNGSWQDFIRDYSRQLSELPDAGVSFSSYMESLDQNQKALCLTLFPACAAIRRESPETRQTLPGAEIINEAKTWTMKVIADYLP